MQFKAAASLFRRAWPSRAGPVRAHHDTRLAKRGLTMNGAKPGFFLPLAGQKEGPIYIVPRNQSEMTQR
jgi:hypothetical protein